MQRIVWALVALLVAKRLAYHLAFIVRDPFALGTYSEAHRYELAARDLLAHPPWGSLPFEVQGLYAYVLALPMRVVPQVVMGLVLQLVLAAGALLLFQRGARMVFGPVVGGLSLCVLLASPELAFYENKYLPVALGVAANIVALVTAVRASERLRARDVVLAGVGAGLSVLGDPALALAVPFSLLAFAVLARNAGKSTGAVLVPFVLGIALALAPMALRNQRVAGSPEVVSSRSFALGLFVGNNPFADGRWNTAGGLLGSVEALEAPALAKALKVRGDDPVALDAAVDRALRDRALAYIEADPVRFVRAAGHKLWLALGNQRFVRDYDLLGESELVGGYQQWGLPFGAVLALGVIGLSVITRRARAVRGERARLVALLLVLCGQLVAVLVANVVLFTSAENRVPLVMPLAFVSGPALEALYGKLVDGSERWRHALPRWSNRFDVRPLALVVGVLACAQAFWPRVATTGRPSAAHYYNLGAVEEGLGRLDDAERHYGKARAQNPRQAIFFLAQGRVLRRLGRFEDAMELLTHIIHMPNTPRELHLQAHAERMLTAAQMTEPTEEAMKKPADAVLSSPPPPLPAP